MNTTSNIRKFALGSGVALAILLTGCASPGPNYSPSIANVELMKKAMPGASVRNGTIAVAADMPGATSVSIRADSMTSPVGANFGDYISASLRQELELAKLMDPKSGTEISGTLLKNNIDAGGFSTNQGQIEARFVVKRNADVKFDKVKRVEHQWESSFVGAIAIPNARNNYPVMVQKLIASLVSDPDFVNAVKP
jgi:hypothetical protein